VLCITRAKTDGRVGQRNKDPEGKGRTGGIKFVSLMSFISFLRINRSLSFH
jgi:hypothetical protein